MARSVEYSERADTQRLSLPLPARRAIARTVRGLADDAGWSARHGAVRLINPGHHPANSGLLAELVPVRSQMYVVVYRIRSTENVVWVEDVREIFVG